MNTIMAACSHSSSRMGTNRGSCGKVLLRFARSGVAFMDWHCKRIPVFFQPKRAGSPPHRTSMQAKPGFLTSELPLSSVGLCLMWEAFPDRPELLIPWTAAVLIAYNLGRAVVKALSSKGELAEVDEVGPPAAQEGGLAMGEQAKAKAAAAVSAAGMALLIALPMLSGCQALQDALLAPLPPQQVTVQPEGGEPVTGELVSPEPKPVEVPLGDGSSLVYTPPAGPQQPTALDGMAQAAGAGAAAATGLPWLAFAVPTVVGAAVAAIGRRKGKGAK